MKLSGKTPQEKAFSTLLHDVNNGTCNLSMNIQRIENWLRKNTKEVSAKGHNLQNIYIAVEYLKSRNKEIQGALDSYYEKFKGDFKE